jgi:ribosomal protein L40E
MHSQERVEPFIEFAGRRKGAIDTESEDIAITEAQEGHWWSCIRCTAVNSGGAAVCDQCSSPRLLKPALHAALGKVPPMMVAAGGDSAARAAAPAASARVKERMMFEALDGSLYASPEEALQHNGLAAVEQLLHEHFGRGDQAAEWIVKNFQNLYLAYVENSKP